MECMSCYCGKCSSIVHMGSASRQGRAVRVCANCVNAIEEKIRQQKQQEEEEAARKLGTTNETHFLGGRGFVRALVGGV